MKKEEILKLSTERSKLLCEYIIQILSDRDIVKGRIDINSIDIDSETMVTFDIFVPRKGFERHLNTGIRFQYVDDLTEQIFNDLVNNFIKSESLGCTKYYNIRGGYGTSMDGVYLTNGNGSDIKLNFYCRGEKFASQATNYNMRVDEYISKEESNSEFKI